MNRDVINGKWSEIKGEIRKMWGNITGDELEKSKGNLTSIAGLIQQRYGQKKEHVLAQFDGIIGKFSEKKEGFKKDIAEVTEAVKKDLHKNNI